MTAYDWARDEARQAREADWARAHPAPCWCTQCAADNAQEDDQ